MIPLDFKKLIPWNLEATHPVFLGDMTVNPKTLRSITFREICQMHKSPTIGVTEEEMKVMAKTTNKYLNISAYATASKPLRPDLSDIEISLIHSTWNNIPTSHLAEVLNVTEVRIKQIRKATEHLYHQANTPLPSLPLVTITDTSRYLTEDEGIELYGNLKTSKDLLRTLKRQSEYLDFPINAQLYSSEDNKNSVHTRASIPSEIPWQDEEGYRGISDILWTYVSREEGVSEILSFTDWNPDNPVIQVPISYKSSLTVQGKVRVLDHEHMEGGYYAPLNIPKPIIKLAVDIINNFKELPPSLENLVIHLMTALDYTTSKMNVITKPTSSSRGHCLPFKGRYTVDSIPLVYPKFTSNTHSYGVICHECSTFLSNNTTNECKHLKFTMYSTPKAPNLPLIYLYSGIMEPNYSLYYYKLDEYHSIHSIYTLNLLQFYSNYLIPVHKVPFEA